jgi:hypothetical protein
VLVAAVAAQVEDYLLAQVATAAAATERLETIVLAEILEL